MNLLFYLYVYIKTIYLLLLCSNLSLLGLLKGVGGADRIRPLTRLSKMKFTYECSSQRITTRQLYIWLINRRNFWEYFFTTRKIWGSKNTSKNCRQKIRCLKRSFIMGGKESKKIALQRVIGQEFSLPRDILIYMIENVSDTFIWGISDRFQFILIDEFINLRLLSIKWKNFVDDEERLWKSFYQQLFKYGYIFIFPLIFIKSK